MQRAIDQAANRQFLSVGLY